MNPPALTEAAIERIDRPHLKFLVSGEPIHPDASLAEAGLDSMTSIDFSFQLEEELGVSIPDEILTGKSLSTLREIRHLVGGLHATV
ncbi:MAG: acyl carrier protein [Verrucomicrobiales bacterium]